MMSVATSAGFCAGLAVSAAEFWEDGMGVDPDVAFAGASCDAVTGAFSVTEEVVVAFDDVDEEPPNQVLGDQDIFLRWPANRCESI